jgi:hypothetical protein
VKLFVADCGVEAESLTVAINPAVPPKFAVPESVPVLASIVSPFTNKAVEEIGAIDQ